jgi:hypothetical protein
MTWEDLEDLEPKMAQQRDDVGVVSLVAVGYDRSSKTTLMAQTPLDSMTTTTILIMILFWPLGVLKLDSHTSIVRATMEVLGRLTCWSNTLLLGDPFTCLTSLGLKC